MEPSMSTDEVTVQRDLTALEQFVVRVAANITGAPEDFVKQFVLDQTPEGAVSDVAEYTGADYIDLIEAIIAILMLLIEQCPQRDAFLSNTRQPSRVLRVWFRIRFVRPTIRRECPKFDIQVVADEIVSASTSASDGERGQIYQDVTKPDFSVF
jgi:hypothetical protein